MHASCVTGLVAAQLLRPDITPCVGDDVTYTCTVNSTVHTWRIDEQVLFSITPQTAVTNNPEFRDPYTLRHVLTTDSGMISTLSVTATSALNGTRVTCQDGLQNSERQNITVSVFGEITKYTMNELLRFL